MRVQDDLDPSVGGAACVRRIAPIGCDSPIGSRSRRPGSAARSTSVSSTPRPRRSDSARFCASDLSEAVWLTTPEPVAGYSPGESDARLSAPDGATCGPSAERDLQRSKPSRAVTGAILGRGRDAISLLPEVFRVFGRFTANRRRGPIGISRCDYGLTAGRGQLSSM